MKTLALSLLALLISAGAYASTTVTVDDDNRNVIVNENAGFTATEPLDDRPSRGTISQSDADFEAEIINVDQQRGQVVVRYLDTVERRLEATKANVATLKTGDHVRVYLRGAGNDNEAWKLVKINQ